MGLPTSRLERIHSYLGDAFGRLDTRADAGRFALGPGALERFREDGFFGPVPVLDAVQVAELGRRLDWLRENAVALADRLYEVEAAWRDRPAEAVFHCLGGWMVDPWLHDVVFDPAVTVPCAECLGVERLRFWHDQVFAKPPRHAGVVPWHQDYSYWTRTAPAAHVTMHIAIDAAGEDSGCVHYVPGSHRWGLFEPVAFGGRMDALVAALPDEHRAGFRPVPVRLGPGEGVLHDSHTVHGSYANRSDRPRRALVLNYMAATVRVAEPGALLAGVPELPVGALVEGDHFPVVLDLAALPR